MYRAFICFIILLVVNLAQGQQKTVTLSPVIGDIPELDARAQKEIDRRDQLTSKKILSVTEKKELERLYEKYDEVTESIWDVVGGGCSWYCGGGPYKETASSFLKSNKSTDYKPENAHDLSFKTAWVEGVPGYGAGQYLTYYFKNDSPRITEINIYNGYVKSEKAWSENSRVKKLKLWINDQFFAILELEDSRALQTFPMAEPLGHRKDGKDLILKFEIMDIYKGTKFDDVAITEIYFDGIDVH